MKNKLRDILVRYFLMIITAFPNLWVFYFIFTPLTIYPVYFLINLFFENVSLSGNFIFIGELSIELISACIAGAAYYLLFILNLSVPNIKIKQRIKMIFFSFFILLIINILRIFSLSWMYVSGFSFFDFAHKFLWYMGSTLFVVGIWFLEVKLFKIKKIPFYSDLKFLYKKSHLKK